ncbi:hypothetical protein ACJ73_03960 [Blastomyces percursus]|uniref:Rho-GAP domain-containing protein n=1 Tax=Blastomyces percursus TaxID=1658174 RepID=A0A1J9Q880_9EURO|nr:hypothetical protein ACJ73_03960 [Blastomyces percursus]
MANSQRSQQDGPSSSSTVPAVLIYSRLPFSYYPPSYGFPQGKAERFFFPESHLPTILTKPTRNSSIPLITMAKKKTSQAPHLELGSSNFNELSQNPRSPLSPLSPTSPQCPTSPYPRGSTIRPLTGKTSPGSISPNAPAVEENNEVPQTPGITAIPQYPSSPKESTKHGRDSSRSFFSNLKASKSSHRLQSSDGTDKQTADGKPPSSRGCSKDRAVNISSRGRNGSSADLPTSSGRAERINSNRNDDQSLRTQSVTDYNLAFKKSKPRFANILTRTRSIRMDDSYATAKNHPPSRRPSNGFLRLEEISRSNNNNSQPPLKTAPLQPDKMFKEVMGSSVRNRSADRPAADDPHSKSQRHLGQGGSLTSSSSLSQVSSASLFNNIKQTSSGAADRLGKAGKGFFGKITRSGSSNEREFPPDETYTCRVINLPLVEQTRRTRISKRLEASKDKTEYWMPALPWRCIDYLNFKGCEEEGLYRVPGSGKDVKHWQRRFDTEYDINLFDEPDLYDINTIGSMFKAWLRELPDEIFPKATQAMIAERCAGATTAPQMLKDELSKLPPFNYYLLFAITCHLSLLHSYVDKNKMDYRNLCICFQPCMKIDGFCFQFLVCDWKNCWQGCWTEKEYLAIELEVERKALTETEEGTNAKGTAIDDRAVSSSGSSQAPNTTTTASSNNNSNSTSSSNTNNNNNNTNAAPNGGGTQTSSRSTSPKRGRKPAPPSINSSHSRSASQLPELGPPLSPIKI